MPILRLNSAADGPQVHGSPNSWQSELKKLPNHRPIIIMLHGYKFFPGHPVHCPHNHILSLKRAPQFSRAFSWPLAMGLEENHTSGLAFGWPARGSLQYAFDRAQQAGYDLAHMISQLKKIAPQRPIHIIAHSLGVRVAIAALKLLAFGSVDRIITIAGAEFYCAVMKALETPAGKSAEFVNIASSENSLFDFLLQKLIWPDHAGDNAMGRHIPKRGNFTSLWIDNPKVLEGLRQAGFNIAAPRQKICHWSGYIRPGIFDFYAACLCRPQEIPINRIKMIAAMVDQSAANSKLKKIKKISLTPLRQQ